MTDRNDNPAVALGPRIVASGGFTALYREGMALIEEVAASKISGEEDRYARTDLYDFQANVDGAQKIVELLKPLLEKADPDLLKKIEDNFATVDGILAKYKTADGGFESYEKLTEEDRNALKAPVTKLFADPALVTRQMIEDLVKYKRLEGVQEALKKIAGQAFEGSTQRRVLRARVDALAPRTLVIWGEADQIIPARHATGLPDTVRVEVLAGYGHMVQMEAVTDVNRLLKAFFDAGA